MKIQRGFTLIEVLVAIVVAAVVLGAGRAIVASVADAAARAARASADQDAEFAGEALARSLVGHARTLQGDSITFLGSQREFVVRTWCPVVGGWTEPCDAGFAIDDSARSLVFRTGFGTGPVPVLHVSESLALRYLASAEYGGRWLDRWSEAGELPIAVGILVGGDTLILPVGR